MAALAQASGSVCAVALHVPTSSMHFGPDIVDDELPSAFRAAGPDPPRRPHPGGLDTLPEASHVNALAHATGPSPPSLRAAMETASLSPSSEAAQTRYDSILSTAFASLAPPSKSRAISRAKGYDFIAIQLANERWRERWTRLCLAPAHSSTAESLKDGNDAPKNKSLFSSTGEPGGMGGSWELLAQAIGAGGLNVPMEGTIGQPGKSAMGKIIRSSSRHHLTDNAQAMSSPAMSTKVESTSSGNGGIPKATSNSFEREAESWRRMPTFLPGEVNLSRYEDGEGVIAVISPWLELDSVDEGIRLDSELALRQELSYASHLGVTQVIVPPPSSDPACRPFLMDYARALAGCLLPRGSEAPAAGHFLRLSIRMPIASPYLSAQAILRSQANKSSLSSSNSASGTAQMRAEDDWCWQTWHIIQNVCGYSQRLSIALDFSAPLPPVGTLERWQAEPVSHVWLPTRAFLTNAKGYPVLSKAVQTFLRSLITIRSPNLCFVLVDTQAPPENHKRGGQAAYEQYIRHLEKAVTSSTEWDAQVNSYADYLQAPLQPLFDNLEGQTYATFESDSIKYEKYEEAIKQALLSMSSKSVVQIWVCGAGRGPLVERCIVASRKADRRVHIVALEKNPNAIVGLRERVVSEWGEDIVQVELGDMRTIIPPREKADLIVSELLGSFGDNELSPECLDGAMRILKPNGVCIPRAYSSYITPISTPKLFSEVSKGTPLSSDTFGQTGQGGDRRLRAVETPYVVLLRAMTRIAAQGGREGWPDIQHCWTFDHSTTTGVPKSSNGLPLTNGHNVRLSNHTFHIPRQSVCHGLAGFFEAHLWGNVVLSIHPDATRKTEGMMSWFPMYFPFKEPLVLAADSELDVCLWRMTSNERVWYEWIAQSFVVTVKPTRATSAGIEGENGTSSWSGASANQFRAESQPIHQQSQESKSTLSSAEAFQNAPQTPHIVDGRALNGASESIAHNGERMLVAMTALMNPGGRSSSVFM